MLLICVILVEDKNLVQHLIKLGIADLVQSQKHEVGMNGTWV